MTITAEQAREALGILEDASCGQAPKSTGAVARYVTETEAALAAKDAEIARLREQFERYCALIEDHPEGWDGECWCRECLSYSGDDDAARAEK